jgi:HD-like signal output (HDOD) protein
VIGPEGFVKLSEMFRRTDLLPQLPQPALRLIALLDGGEPSSLALERVISSDPALVTSVLRTASSAVYGSREPVTTIRSAIMRLGYRGIRTLAVSFSLQAMLSYPARRSSFNPGNFARHSLFTAILTQYAFVRRLDLDPKCSALTPEEAFSGGMLHDISVALLSRVAPDAYDQTVLWGRHRASRFEDAFQELYQSPVCLLGVTALEAWRLPPFFVEAVCASSSKEAFATEPVYRSCLLWADRVAIESGYAHEPYRFDSEVPDMPVPLGAELPAIIEVVAHMVSEFLKGTFGRAA